MNINLDTIDYAILAELQSNANISNVRLAERIGLSPAATLSRVKKLESEGIIKGYTALLDTDKLGLEMNCFVLVSLSSHSIPIVNQFREAIQEMSNVLDCFFITGNGDYLLRIAVQNRQELEHFLVHTLTPAPGVGRLETSLILNEVKSNTPLPLTKPTAKSKVSKSR